MKAYAKHVLTVLVAISLGSHLIAGSHDKKAGSEQHHSKKDKYNKKSLRHKKAKSYKKKKMSTYKKKYDDIIQRLETIEKEHADIISRLNKIESSLTQSEHPEEQQGQDSSTEEDSEKAVLPAVS
jgi:DNA repair exonuclease SbcCD ATPase subunit